jgi:flagellar biosynthesis/type III secretory pathway protein FliH
VGRSQGHNDVWEKGYSKGYADANADDDGRLNEAYQEGVEATENTFKPRLDRERQTGKDLGYNSGWDDGYEAHKTTCSRQAVEEADEVIESAWAADNGASWDVGQPDNSGGS